MWGLSYWAIPIFSSLVWMVMLVTMLAVWTAEGRPHYDSMSATQRIPYISDIGAHGLKPMFIAMSAVTVVSFDLAFILERWFRHSGRLAPNTSIWQKIYSVLAIIFAIAGGAGLILLAVFDTLRHPTLHIIFLVVFIGGYILSAVFICWQYQRLGIHFRSQSVLRISFWIKLAFILVELALCVAFAVSMRRRIYDTAAVLEWVIAFLFFFFVLSFFIDFMPAVRTKHHQSSETEMDVAKLEASAEAPATGDRYYNNASTSQNNGVLNGQHNGNDMHPGYPQPAMTRKF